MVNKTIKTFLVCNQCNNNTSYHKGDELTLSTCDGWQYCSICGRYAHFKDYVVVNAEVVLIEKQECDCIEKYGCTKHNDGGNYHITTYRIKKVIGVE